jgi:mono/diheme cytochrome c family protein
VAARHATPKATSAPAAAKTGSARLIDVINVYRKSCLPCHDGDGRGEAGRASSPRIPDFTEASWHTRRTDAQLSRSILEGKGKSMPRMKGKLGSVGVLQMVKFVRGFRGGKQKVEDAPADASNSDSRPVDDAGTGSGLLESKPEPASGKALSIRAGSQLFRRFCARCHGTDGRGTDMRGSLPEIPDFTVAGWHERRSDPQLIAVVLDGKGSGMPAFGDKLARQQVRHLIAFLREFATSSARQSSSSSDDFESRFRQLTEEFEQVRREYEARFGPTGRAPVASPRDRRQ